MSMLCSRCKKRVAVVFMTRMENGKTINEGLCLQCAKELGIGPVNELMEKMGITDDEIENMNDQLIWIPILTIRILFPAEPKRFPFCRICLAK